MLKMPNSESRTKPRREEEAPTIVIEAPLNYEQTHELAECPYVIGLIHIWICICP
jgi:hypothetical protein